MLQIEQIATTAAASVSGSARCALRLRGAIPLTLPTSLTSPHTPALGGPPLGPLLVTRRVFLWRTESVWNVSQVCDRSLPVARRQCGSTRCAL